VRQLERERESRGRFARVRTTWPARQGRKVANLVKGMIHAP
jgi:hypothetical protein